jgi:DNA-3-methyladenine glycosylase I
MRHTSRCGWVKLSDPLYVSYHDNEWGKPLHDNQALFEHFSLETQAAGLSWLTVLKKREGYRKAFNDFDLEKVARFDEADIDAILQNHEVIKSRPKLSAIVHNAKAFLRIQEEFGSLDAYFWSHVDFAPIINDIPDYQTAPCTSPVSDAMTKDLKKRGFKFVGSVSLYAFMQACGMVNDHENGCPWK